MPKAVFKTSFALLLGRRLAESDQPGGQIVILKRGDGPARPTYPTAFVHPLGPLFRHLPIALRRHLLFFRAHKKWGNFNAPKTWREKMQWRILNDRRTILSVACDKLAQKDFDGVHLFPEGSEFTKTFMGKCDAGDGEVAFI